MKLRDVRHLTDDPSKDWNKFIDQQDSLAGFLEGLCDWDGLVEDVKKVVANWDEKDLVEFKRCIRSERKGIFMGEENAKRFAAVLMPALMFKASYVAFEFKVPWGVACLRLVECDPDFEQLKAKK